MLPSELSPGAAAAALVSDVAADGALTTTTTTGNRVSEISLQSSKALQELVARRTVLAVMSRVIQVAL